MSVMQEHTPPSGRTRRRFTKEFKADAVALAARGGPPPASCLTPTGPANTSIGSIRLPWPDMACANQRAGSERLGQQRRRVVLRQPQTRTRRPAPLRHPRPGPTRDLRLDRPPQHPAAPLQPRLPDADRMGGPTPPETRTRRSSITTCQPNGGSPVAHGATTGNRVMRHFSHQPASRNDPVSSNTSNMFMTPRETPLAPPTQWPRSW